MQEVRIYRDSLTMHPYSFSTFIFQEAHTIFHSFLFYIEGHIKLQQYVEKGTHVDTKYPWFIIYFDESMHCYVPNISSFLQDCGISIANTLETPVMHQAI